MTKSNWQLATQVLWLAGTGLGRFAGAKLDTFKTKSLFKELGYDSNLYKLFEQQQQATSTANLGMCIQATQQIIEYLVECGKTSHQGIVSHQIILASQIFTLGGYYLELGNFEQAELKLIEALDIFKKYNDKSDDYSILIYNLGYLYLRKAIYEEGKKVDFLNQAVEKFTEALTLRKKIYTEKPSIKNEIYVSRSFKWLAFAYQQLGEYNNAKKTYWDAIQWKLERTKEKFGDNYTHKLGNLINLIEFKLEDGAFSIPFISFIKDWADVLTALGQIYFDEGEYIICERLYLKSLNALEELYGAENERLSPIVASDHPELQELFICLSQVLTAKNNPQSGLEYLKKSVQISSYEIRIKFAISSETDRLAFIKTQKEVLNLLLSLVWGYLQGDQKMIKFALDVVLQRKSLTASAIASQNQAIFSDGYPELQPKFEKLKSLNDEITNLTYSAPSVNEQKTLKTKQEEFNTLQRELAEKIPEIKQEQDLQNTNSDSIAFALPENSVLIEIVRFDVYNFQAIPARGESRFEPSRYLAFILPKDKPEEIEMIDLGVAGEIDEMIKYFLYDASDGQGNKLDIGDDEDDEDGPILIREYNLQTAINLSQRLLTPILSKTGKAKHLFIAPDSELNLIPFNILPLNGENNLPLNGENSLLMDEYTISYLSVGRDALRFKFQPTNSTSEPLVIADPDFDLENSATENQATENQSSPEITSEIEDLGYNIGNKPFHRTTGTRILGEVVAQKLAVTPYLGEKAVESVIYNHKNPSIFFIATHGVFLSQPLPSLSNQEIPLNLSRDISNILLQTQVENPMLRSGLALAGANIMLSGGKLSKGKGKGFLFAQDVLTQDFWGTDIAFLIACETGRGDTSTGEGVFGMRRAFAVAGAKTLIMSLWKVPDKVSALLITKFFEYLQQTQPHRLGKAAALQQAQNYIRQVTIRELQQTSLGIEIIKELSNITEYDQEFFEDEQDEQPLKHPYYWGAWICQGDINLAETLIKEQIITEIQNALSHKDRNFDLVVEIIEKCQSDNLLNLAYEFLRERKESLDEITQQKIEKALEEYDYLIGVRDIDYSKLRNLLSNWQWKEANQETEQLITKEIKKQSLKKEIIEGWQDLSISFLLTIDRLWRQYSNGHFGFSVQKSIFSQYQLLDEETNIQWQEWNKIAESLGWKINNYFKSLKKGYWKREDEITFGFNTEHGHLPWLNTVFGWQQAHNYRQLTLTKAWQHLIRIPLSEVDLYSETGIDYTLLQELLKSRQWKKANQETQKLILRVVNRENEGWLDANSTDKFPVTDLHTIEQLWLKHSNGLFGFSVQKSILIEVFHSNADKSTENILNKFGVLVGWKTPGGNWKQYNNLSFDTTVGQLPTLPLSNQDWEMWENFLEFVMKL